jgi:hypothetical protein
LPELQHNDYELLKAIILKIVRKEDPKTIKELIYLAKKETNLSENDLFIIIQDLQEEKQLRFRGIMFPESLVEYLFSSSASWYWLIFILSTFSVYLFFSISQDITPQNYLRGFIGLIFVLYLPGYALMKTLYPVNVPYKTGSLILDSIERFALNLGLSLALAPLAGTILYYLPCGLTLFSVTFILFILILLFSSLGIVREYKERKSLFLGKIVAVDRYEFIGNTLKFFEIQGFLKKRQVVKEFSIKDITNIDSKDRELSITFGGITNIFLMPTAESSINLCDKIRGMTLDQKS